MAVDESKRCESHSYELMQIVPCDDMQAVYAEDSESEPGKFWLRAHRIYFIGLARVKTMYMEPRETPKGIRWFEWQEPSFQVGVVGLDLAEGFFTVCDDYMNFAGLCRVGDDIREASGCLVPARFPLSESGD